MTLHATTIAVALTAACGRIAFDPVVDGPRVDARSDDAAPVRCDPMTPFTSIRPLDELNGPDADGGLRLSDDELLAFFHTNTQGPFRVWTSRRMQREVPFDPPTRLFDVDALWPVVSSDLLTLVYNDYGVANLQLSMRGTTAEPFAPGTQIPGLATAGIEQAGMLNRETSALYFTRDGSIMWTPWPTDGSVQMVASVETAAAEGKTALSSDGRVMYFVRASTSEDILVAVRSDPFADAFGPAIAVAELNTVTNDAPTWLSVDQCRLYFESDRSGGYEIYVAERAP
jgi:hypothetical protein